MAEYIEREALKILFAGACAECRDSCAEFDGIEADCNQCLLNGVIKDAKSIPAAYVPPALWTDEPISGTEFMTHNQGQSGFEIHFRTDDKAKYEAVQDECRRQLGHAKPAADVRPVVTCGECKHWETDWKPRGASDGIHYCMMVDLCPSADWFCADGEKREES